MPPGGILFCPFLLSWGINFLDYSLKIADVKSWMRGSGSCTHLQAGAAGRLQMVWQDSCGVWSGHMYSGARRGGGSGGRGVFPSFHPITLSDCVAKCCSCSLYMCVCLKECAWLIQGFLWYLWITSGHADRRLWIPPVHHSVYTIMLKGTTAYITVWSHSRACSFHCCWISSHTCPAASRDT